MFRSRAPMTSRVRRRVAPVDASIHWKPLRDPHYVLASLQRDRGGHRQIFAEQAALTELRARAHSAHGQLLGLLLGRQYECPESGMRYVLIESAGAPPAVSPIHGAIAATLTRLIDQQAGGPDTECVGWYTAGASAERVGSAHGAIHTSVFTEPWQTLLVLADNGATGGFFLRDSVESRWFLAPFYEVAENKRNQRPGKPTHTAWPTYLTTDVVVPVVVPVDVPRVTTPAARSIAPVAAPAPVTARPVAPSTVAVRPTSLGDLAPRPAPRPSDREVPVAPAAAMAVSSVHVPDVTPTPIVVPPSTSPQPPTSRPAVIPRPARIAPLTAPGTASQEPPAFAAMVRAALPVLERVASRALRAAVSLGTTVGRQSTATARAATAHLQSALVERAERRARLSAEREEHARVAAEAKVVALRSPHPATDPILLADIEDTTASDHPDRYVELARREGFEVWSQLEFGTSERPDVAWVLHHPGLGIRLTLATSDQHVYEATLHYNVCVDDDALLQATPAGHRDLASRTIYVREACVDHLRARCRRLRGAGTLVREWKVAPGLHSSEAATQHR